LEKRGPGFLTLVAAILLLHITLLLPGHPQAFRITTFLRLALELPLILLALTYLHGTARTIFRSLLVAIIGAVVILRLADIGSYMAFDRRFSPLVEMHLLGDGWNLASQSIGLLQASIAVTAALLLLIGLCYLLFISLGALAHWLDSNKSAKLKPGIIFLLVLIGGLAVMAYPQRAERDLRVQAGLIPEVNDRILAMRKSIRDQSVFLRELAIDPVSADRPPTFAALQGRDVIVVFVESYGRSFLQAPRFTSTSQQRLANVEQTITAAGLHARSAWLTSTIRGGRSWLAHATFNSGLPISNQARFDRLISSNRKSLSRLFGEAGWQTAGLMPAIQLAWPEGAWYGFGDTYNMAQMNYQGEKFGWVTMPDQYTLSAFEQIVRTPAKGPVMAELALISSHAPWTPLPRLLPWDNIGDGSVFDGSHRFGEPVRWSDAESVRDMYAQSLDYSLEVLGQYMARHGNNTVFIILGDHQPPAIINGWGETADVPIHIISDDPALLERLKEAQWSIGMHPAATLPSQRMESMREALVQVFAD
jgi:hypothetical protein